MMSRFLPAAVLAAWCASAAAHDCLPYQPAEVTLTGDVTQVHGIKAGTKGTREDYYVLTLPEMACLTGGTEELDEDIESIDAFQLKPPPGATLPKGLVGRRVAVTGLLAHRIVDETHTDVMLNYTAAKLAP
ncbi:MAG: hypothetical protein PW843_08280 [Azospirillaceae bacterium]|nr:hypothetical protein [Azospirillaceae bacterium]